MGFFKNLFTRKKAIEEIIDEKLEARMEDFETRLFEKLAQAFPTKEEKKEDVPKLDEKPALFPKVYPKSVLWVNDTLTCYINDSKYECAATEELWTKVSAANTEEEIKILMETPLAKLKQKEEEEEMGEEDDTDEYQKEVELTPIQTNYCKELIANTDDFELVNGELRMKGINLSIPGLLVDKFSELIKGIYTDKEPTGYELEMGPIWDAEYQALVNFWLWLAQNPNEMARKDLFKFLKAHDLRVNANGFFFTYRRVVVKDNVNKVDQALQTFVGSEFLKVKTKWKKNTANFSVVKTDEGYKLFETKKLPTEGEVVGVLKDLHESPVVNDVVTYTDAHTGTMTIQIGKEVRIPRQKCDDNNGVDCSRGLHSGNKSFGFGSSYGTASILCLINPMDVVSIPKYGSNKMRSCAYLPVAVLSSEGSTPVDFLEDAHVLSLADDYLVGQVERLPRLLAGKEGAALMSTEAETAQTANVRLQTVADTIKNRVVKV